MIDQGSVVQISRSFLTPKSVTGPSPLIPDSRPALCLLPKMFAGPFDAQIVIHGTTKGSSLPETWPSAQDLKVPDEYLDSLELGHRWQGKEARPTAWKAFHLDPAVMDGVEEERGTIRGEWKEDARRLLNAILCNPALARQEFAKANEKGHPRKEIHKLSGGDLIRIGEREFIVLSNEAIHRHFRYGIVFACPLADASQAFKGSRATRLFRGMRIAWELAQHVPLECLAFEQASALEGAQPELLAPLRQNLLRFWAGATPDGLGIEPFQAYLRLCAEARQTPGTPSIPGLGGAVKVCRYPVTSSRGTTPGGRHFAGSSPRALPNDEAFALETGSPVLKVSIKRSGSQVVAYFQRAPGTSVKLLYASVEDQNAQEISYVGHEGILASHGVAAVALGEVSEGVHLLRTVSVGTTDGREVFDIDLHWSFNLLGLKTR